jgi:hypothetical protein
VNSPHSPLRVLTPPHSSRGAKPFCGHCGRAPRDDVPSALSRVCPRCGLGLILRAPAEVVPTASDPFLVVDTSLAVCALSRHAELLLGVSETDAVNRHVTQFLVPAEPEAPTPHNLVALLAWAARGHAEPRSVVVRPTGTFGVRYWARVGSCGPPPAALVVLASAA